MKNVILLLTAIFLAAASCNPVQNSDIEPVEANLRQLTSNEAEMVQSNVDFALRFFQEMEKENLDNHFTGPFSIHQALSMAMNGNEGDILQEYLDVLAFHGLTKEEANTAIKSLTEYLKNVDPKVKVNIANGIWYREGLRVQAPFKTAMETYFNANISALNFEHPNAHQVINNWIASQTNDLIKDMLNSIPREAVMYLVNAIYFKGDWKFQFDPQKTKKEPFFPEKGGSVQVDMMESKEKVTLKTGGNGRVNYLEIPYSTGQYQMAIIQANSGTLSSILPEITTENLALWSENSRESNVILKMPKFKMRYKEENLNSKLENMGLVTPFSPNPANFTKIFEGSFPPMLISRVIHEALIEVDEKGTEAAAATIIEISVTSMPSGPSIIKLDKPFYFLIKEKNSGSILFMGKLGNPSLL
ncbi:serpin family protein [Cecembia calidifontis]|jgi:serpin B|uniref:Serpin B n=1 Tax=Cecembia calidifontis TaxID=1187080 RepID=A0A4Q7P9P6_9BACT|nr:serpin family protein [Cecembia calidifontis]RZS96956.1 serpin B [Cecembia calidifontis]